MGPIAKGDLVVIARDCCTARLGYIGEVARIATPAQMGYGRATCNFCGAITDADTRMVELPKYFCRLSSVKRIDPPALSDSTPTREELTA